MILIRATRTENALDIRADGHAGYAEAGRDIVCAGVSALLFGLLAYWRERLPRIQQEVGDGSLRLTVPAPTPDDLIAWAVTATGLALLAAYHPACVRLEDLSTTAPPTSTQEKE